MKVQSFEYMNTIYEALGDLSVIKEEERNGFLTKYKHSVIVEGAHEEFDNLKTWIKQSISVDPLEEIYYGKTDYDYGFAELFLEKKIDEEKLILAVNNIYTTWGNGTISRTDSGSMANIAYSPNDKDAIVYPNYEWTQPGATV